MRVLFVGRYKAKLPGHAVAFVAEQFASLKNAGCKAELFPLK